MFEPNSVIVTVNSETCIKSSYVRRYFEKKLLENIKKKLKYEKILFTSAKYFNSRIIIETPQPEKVFSSLQKCFGINALSISQKIYFNSINNFFELALNLFDSKNTKGTFAVKAKSYSAKHSSKQIEIDLGSKILEQNPELKVNLSSPEKKINILFNEKDAMVFFDSIKASSGLPVASQGRVAILCDGTINDEKLGWLLLKKGCTILLIGRKEIPSLSEWSSYHKIPTKSIEGTKKLYVEGIIRAFFTSSNSLVEIDKINSKLSVNVFAPFLLNEVKTPFD